MSAVASRRVPYESRHMNIYTTLHCNPTLYYLVVYCTRLLPPSLISNHLSVWQKISKEKVLMIM